MIQERKKEAGFTLVELAIVMMIIGLLLGGILKGQELIKNARISATGAQLKAFESAITSFRDIYGGKPGDLNNAATRVPGCAAGNTNSCQNGNGDSYIWGAKSINYWPGTSIALESRQAFKHLALADLIGGVNASTANYLEAWPLPEIGEGYIVMGEHDGAVRSHLGGTSNTPAGIYVGITRQANWTGTYGRVMSPAEAARLDRKIDDGSPGTGSLLATGAGGCVSGTAYNEVTGNNDCGIIYRVQ